VSQHEIAKNLLKLPFWGSRLFKVIDVKARWHVLVMMSSISVPICNRFHAGRANSGKITFLR